MRPLNDAEAERGSSWRIDANKIVPLAGAAREEGQFVLDRVFDSASTTAQVLQHLCRACLPACAGVWQPRVPTQHRSSSHSGPAAQVFEHTAADLIAKVVEGFNGTVFAYGQTSSGKTHTMRGLPSAPGIIPLSIQAVFDCIESAQDREFLLRVSYIEVRAECRAMC